MVRRVFWLAHYLDDRHRAHAQELERYGFRVYLFRTIAQFEKSLRKARVGIFIFSDNGSAKIVKETLLLFLRNPLVVGTRLILSVEKGHADVAHLAASNCFRDLIPLDLDAQAWVYRVLYSCADKDLSFPVPSKHLAQNLKVPVQIPVRLVWADQSTVHIEGNFAPAPGTMLNLQGPFMNHLGLRQVQVRVTESVPKMMRYRFAQGITCTWDFPEASKEKCLKEIEGFQFIDGGRQVRVFAALKSRELRNSLVDKLDSSRLFVSFALRKKALLLEPTLFCPDLLLVEDKLCSGEAQKTFLKLLRALPTTVPVVILGKLQQTDEELILRKSGDRKIFLRDFVPLNFAEVIFSDYLKVEEVIGPATMVNFAAEDQFSYGIVAGTAVLKALHPQYLSLSLPFPILRYAIFQVPATFLLQWVKRYPWFKAVRLRGEVKARSASEVDVLLLDAGTEAIAYATMRTIELATKGKAGQTQTPEQIAATFAPLHWPLPKLHEASNAEQYAEVMDTAQIARAVSQSAAQQVVRFFKSRLVKFIAVYLGASAILVLAAWLVIPFIAEKLRESGGVYAARILEYAGSVVPPDLKEEVPPTEERK